MSAAARKYRHGLVLGKFYPPHAGHHHLVRTALTQCDRLTVLVCAASVESLPRADPGGGGGAAPPRAPGGGGRARRGGVKK
ncbi:adenylyltransferase/cytidyltransferase family protein, partial [Streptomyces sp. NPDC059766]|uniref:adenylyltransferase/cytidyltransferase family protein n=1 Tax=Streptomyces sp. NPDC059766 TaxID=3346940 RepID=UPI003669C1E8